MATYRVDLPICLHPAVTGGLRRPCGVQEPPNGAHGASFHPTVQAVPAMVSGAGHVRRLEVGDGAEPQLPLGQAARGELMLLHAEAAAIDASAHS